MRKLRFLNRTRVITTVVLVICLLFASVADARRGRGKGRRGRYINNIVNLMSLWHMAMILPVPPTVSGDCSFEKGDAIYRQFDMKKAMLIMKMTYPPGFPEPILTRMARRLLTRLSKMGHCGLYHEWEPDELSKPEIRSSHGTIESNLARPIPKPKFWEGAGVHSYYDFQYFLDAENFWGVRTSIKLDFEERTRIVEYALYQEDKKCKYDFFHGYKHPGLSFRCDGLVEYCYERVGIDIIENDWWCIRRGYNPLCPNIQMRALQIQNKTEFPVLTFGKYDDEGEKIYGPIEISGEDIDPDENDKYKVYGDKVKVKIYASDIDVDNDGSGITRVQLWVGDPDDTPEEMPGFRIVGSDDDKDYPRDHDYTYTWDTTEEEDDEPLFPDGDYTLKAIAFDQAGNKKEATLPVEVASPEKYLHVRIAPAYVESHNTDKTDPFTIYVQVYDYGIGGTTPEGGVNKKEGTQSYKIVDGKPALEKCYTDQVEQATKDSTFNGIVNISTLFSDIDGISLYKENPDGTLEKWDGILELTNGYGDTSDIGKIRYKTNDGSELTGSGRILPQAKKVLIRGNDLLLVNYEYIDSYYWKRCNRRGRSQSSTKSWAQLYSEALSEMLSSSFGHFSPLGPPQIASTSFGIDYNQFKDVSLEQAKHRFWFNLDVSATQLLLIIQSTHFESAYYRNCGILCTTTGDIVSLPIPWKWQIFADVTAYKGNPSAMFEFQMPNFADQHLLDPPYPPTPYPPEPPWGQSNGGILYISSIKGAHVKVVRIP